jgi:hypothetical protein
MVPLMKASSVYTRIGDLFAMACLALVVLAMLVVFVKWKTNRGKG